MVDGKEITTKHPVAYISGLFHGSQLNWAAMTKEAYAIYMTVKRSTFYITSHDVTLRSDHLPLNKFLKQMTLNNIVNNWAMEIESFKIKFIHIAGKDNVLADTLSRLIYINPDVELQPELKDYEFGHYAFETKARSKMVHEVLTSLDGVNVCEINITYDNSENSPYSVKLPLSNKKCSCLQDKDLKVRQLMQIVIQGQYTKFYFVKKGTLYRSVVDNGHKFEVAVVPEDLIGTVLYLGHNQSGHNGYQRTYATIKCVYYWKGMTKHVLVHCKNCLTCAKQKVQKT